MESCPLSYSLIFNILNRLVQTSPEEIEVSYLWISQRSNQAQSARSEHHFRQER